VRLHDRVAGPTHRPFALEGLSRLTRLGIDFEFSSVQAGNNEQTLGKRAPHKVATRVLESRG
jgi:hypothetical protein